MTTKELVLMYMKDKHRNIIFKTLKYTYNAEYGQIFVTYTKSGDIKVYTETIIFFDYITFLFNINYRKFGNSSLKVKG